MRPARHDPSMLLELKAQLRALEAWHRECMRDTHVDGVMLERLDRHRGWLECQISILEGSSAESPSSERRAG